MHVPAMMNDWNGKGPVTVRNVLGRGQCGNQGNLIYVISIFIFNLMKF